MGRNIIRHLSDGEPALRDHTWLLALAWSLLSASSGAAVNLGDEAVPRERIVVFIVIGHSNVLSNVEAEPVPGQTWNYVVPGNIQRVEGWVQAQNPMHVSEAGTVSFSGPGKPLLTRLAAAYPGYHVGALQNPNNRAAVRWIDPAPPSYIDASANRYCDGCGLYSEIMTHATDLEPQVTIAGIIAMLGFMAAKEEGTARSFAEDTRVMVAAIRRDLGMPELPFLIDAGNFDGTNKFTHWETVREQIQLIPTLVPHSAVVDGGLTAADYFDGHHYNDGGHDKWAARAVEIIQERGWFPIAAEPELSLTPSALTFSVEVVGAQPAVKEVSVDNLGTGVLEPVVTSVSYTAGAGGWLNVTRAAEGNGQLLSNQVSLAGLSAGSHCARVEVGCANATNSPVTYTVFLEIEDQLEVAALRVTPEHTALQAGAAASFRAAALDQHGEPIAAVVSWTTSGSGSFAPSSCDESAVPCEVLYTVEGVPGELVLTAVAGEVSGSATVTVLPRPSITLTRPVGGEIWRAGEVEQIEWSTEALDSVVIYSSVDHGATWSVVEAILNDTDARWERYPWELPELTSDGVRVRVTGYFGEVPAQSASFQIRLEADGPSVAEEDQAVAESVDIGSGCACAAAAGAPASAGSALLPLFALLLLAVRSAARSRRSDVRTRGRHAHHAGLE